MREIEEALENLIDVLLETEEYNDYQDAREEMKGYPELQDRVDEFRKRNFELQNSSLDGPRLFEEIDRFETEYEEFRSDPRVNKFLSSELALVKLLQNIYRSIMDNVDFE